jgi:type II secretory pathway component PulF
MRTVSASNQEWLWEETAHAVRRGRPLADIFRELSQSTSSRRRRALARRLAHEVNSGKALSSAAAGIGGALQPGTAAAIEAGEKSGHLADTLDALAENAVAGTRLRSLVMDAIGYPLVVAFGASCLLFFMRLRIVPLFRKMYHEWNMDLPPMTKALFAFPPIAICALVVPALALLVFFVLPVVRVPGWRTIDAIRLRVPLLGGVVRRMALARWCNTMGILATAGVPEGKAVRLAGEGAGNVSVAAASRRVADLVDSGLRLGDAMEARRFFPSVLSWMVRASSATGGHVYLWPTARDAFREQAERFSLASSIVLRVFFFALAFCVVGLTVLALLIPLIRPMYYLGG